MPGCVAVDCYSSTDKNERISFHRFPQCDYLRSAWIRAIRRSGFKPSIKSVLCSKHFEDCYFLETEERLRLRCDAIPTLFSTHSFDCKDHCFKSLANATLCHQNSIFKLQKKSYDLSNARKELSKRRGIVHYEKNRQQKFDIMQQQMLHKRTPFTIDSPEIRNNYTLSTVLHKAGINSLDSLILLKPGCPSSDSDSSKSFSVYPENGLSSEEKVHIDSLLERNGAEPTDSVVIVRSSREMDDESCVMHLTQSELDTVETQKMYENLFLIYEEEIEGLEKSIQDFECEIKKQEQVITSLTQLAAINGLKMP